MTQIFCLGQDDAFQALVQVNEDGDVAYEDSVAIRATSLCGKPFGTDYVPAKLSWGSSRRKKNPDIHVMLSPFLVLNGKSLSALSPFLRDCGQVLPVDSPVADAKGFHVTETLIDAVDMTASKFKVYPQATVFNKIVLLEDRVRGVDIFRIKEKPATVFVSDRFKEAVRDNHLTGFDFSEQVTLSTGT